jgi:Ca2+-binding EF-hand superfamily protein
VTRAFLLGAAGAFLVAGAACSKPAEQAKAQSSAGAAMNGEGHGRGGFLRRMDANGDGKISLAEMQQGQAAMFARVDTNGDGKIDGAELDALPNERMAERLEKADLNKDGTITRVEYDQATARSSAERFKRMDKNGDGVVDAAEMKAAMEARRAEMGGGE